MHSPFAQRVLRAARLDPSLYEEVEADRSALPQATGVVVMSAVAGGIGSFGTRGVVVGTLVTLVGWYVWAYLVYFIGTRLLPEPQTSADHAELLRTTGFASAPGLIRVFGILPGLQAPLFAFASLWMLVAMTVAVRQALDYRSVGRTVAVCLMGWAIQSLLLLPLLL